MKSPLTNRDIGLYTIGKKLDDRSLFRYCSSSKEILTMCRQNDEFWKQRLAEKYPGLLLIKEKEYQQMKYMKFYLLMAKYIAKLEEKFGIPYINNPKFDPFKFYQRWEYQDNVIYDIALEYAAGSGEIEIIKKLILLGATAFQNALNKAIKKGQLAVVKYLLNDFNIAPLISVTATYMKDAIQYGQLEILKYLLAYYTNIFNQNETIGLVIKWAIDFSQLGILKYLVEKAIESDTLNIYSYQYYLYLAVKENNLPILEYLVETAKKYNFSKPDLYTRAIEIANRLEDKTMFDYLINVSK